MALKILKFTAVMLFICSLFVSILHAQNSPILNDGKKWRIGYYEGGPYSDYTDTMRTLIKGLIELGWIKNQTPPDYHEGMPKPYLDWLNHSNSPYLSFRSEDAYSANWDDQQRSVIKKDLLRKLKLSTLDLVIAMGTWAGLDLANNEHTVPVLVLSTSDPIGAGIIKSAENSGYDHVTARVDPTRYIRQIRMFHRLVDFKTLGIAYEDSLIGRVYSAISDAQQVAKERGFKIISCEVLDSIADADVSDQSCLECYRQLSQKTDAVYVTALTCIDRKAKEIADIFRNAQVPSFSMVGSKYIKAGLMLSISSDSGYTGLGKYNAEKFSKILNGTMPRALKQVFEDPLDIAVNMETVRKIAFDMPESILKIATEIYEP